MIIVDYLNLIFTVKLKTWVKRICYRIFSVKVRETHSWNGKGKDHLRNTLIGLANRNSLFRKREVQQGDEIGKNKNSQALACLCFTFRPNLHFENKSIGFSLCKLNSLAIETNENVGAIFVFQYNPLFCFNLKFYSNMKCCGTFFESVSFKIFFQQSGIKGQSERDSLKPRAIREDTEPESDPNKVNALWLLLHS